MVGQPAELTSVLGQQVCALVAGGGYAQFCLAGAGYCLPVPAGLPLEQAAALPETRFTVWHPVMDRVFPEAAQAHRIMESGGHVGKIVLAVPARGQDRAGGKSWLKN